MNFCMLDKPIILTTFFPHTSLLKFMSLAVAVIKNICKAGKALVFLQLTKRKLSDQKIT